jgi:hypothetical protein
LIISLTDRAIERGELTAADVERLAPPGTEVVLRDATGAWSPARDLCWPTR